MRKFVTVLLCYCFCIANAQHATIANIKSDEEHKDIKHSNEPAIINSSFELVDRLIFVKAELAGENRDFIFDTGAPVLIINSDKIPEPELSVKALGVCGDITANSIYIDTFEWNGLLQREFVTYAIDISHLEDLTRRNIGGLIGYNAIKDYELMISYDDHRILMFKDNATVYHNKVKPIDSIAFTLYDHFPVIEININGKPYKFGLDSGAEFNLMDSSLLPELKDHFAGNIEEIELYGADKSVKNVVSVDVDKTHVAGYVFENMEYVFTDISHLNDEGSHMDGLLGYPFLSSRLFSINFNKGMIYIWR